MDLVILTPLALEYHAFQTYLINKKAFLKANTMYETGQFSGQYHTYNIAIRQTGAKNNPMALAVEQAIASFQPSLILLGGIAGGVKDVAIGDVVVATKAYGYESGKETKDGFLARPEVFAFDKALIELAQHISRGTQWKKRLANPKSTSKVFFGPVASGDKVIATRQSPVYRLLQQSYNDTIALDMEAIGFTRALDNHRQVRGFNVRGISDLLDHKTINDQKGTQEVAAANAAAFTFELLFQLDFSSQKINVMDNKTLLQKIIAQIFPILRLESVQNIGSEFKGAINTTIEEIWEKVRPIFIEEIVNVGEDIQDEEVQQEVQSAIKANLRKAFRKDTSLQKELTVLLQRAEQEEEKNSNTISISNSKNVMQGNHVSGVENFHIGDQEN